MRWIKPCSGRPRRTQTTLALPPRQFIPKSSRSCDTCSASGSFVLQESRGGALYSGQLLQSMHMLQILT